MWYWQYQITIAIIIIIILRFPCQDAIRTTWRQFLAFCGFLDFVYKNWRGPSPPQISQDFLQKYMLQFMPMPRGSGIQTASTQELWVNC